MPLIQLFLDICLLRKGPQDVPAAKALLQLSVAAYFVVGLAQTLLETDWLGGLLQVLLQAVILVVFIGLSLLAAGKTNRLPQTLTAMFGTDALISSFALPLEALAIISPEAGLVHFALLLLMLWHLAVVGHILRHALSQSLAIGLMLSFVYMAFTLQVLVMLFGVPTPEG